MVRPEETQARRGTRRWLIRAIVPVLALAALLPSMVSAWMSWSGIDPVLKLSTGEKVSIYLEWPTEMTCSIDDDDKIDVEVTLPRNVKAKVLFESSDDFGCVRLKTDTDVEQGEWRADKLKVETRIKAKKNFPVNVHVTVDGDTTIINGRSNSKISGTVQY